MISIANNPGFEDKLNFVINDTQNPYLHVHEEIELLYVLHGTAKVTNQRNRYELGPEDFIVFNAYELHSVVGNKGTQTLSLYLSPSILNLMRKDGERSQVHCVSTENGENMHLYRAIRQLLANLFYRYTQADYTERFLFWGDCFQLFEICLQTGREDVVPPIEIPSEGKRCVFRVVQYLSEHYAELITLETMAAREYITAGHLSKLFKSCIGCTFLQYLNALRLSHALADLKQTDCSITDIAMRNGFRSTNRFIQLFREQFGDTPGHYRKGKKESSASPKQEADQWSPSFQPLLRHMRKESPDPKIVRKKRCETNDYTADISTRGYPLERTWDRILNIGTAIDGLLAPVQEQIRRAQREIGFTYIRLSGILDNNILILRVEDSGEVSCNFVYIDLLLDFCLSLGLKPYMEFSFMPTQLATDLTTCQFSSSCISPPKDFRVWGNLIRCFVSHLMKRYGRDELAQWLFSPMRSTYQFSGLLSTDDYLNMYHVFYQVIKCENSLTICGLGNDLDTVFYQDGAILAAFLEFCKTHDCFPDYLTMQSYNCLYEKAEDDSIRSFLLQDIEPFPLSDDPSYLKNRTQKFFELLKRFDAPPIPIILEDWGFSQWQRDPRNDTAYKAPFLVKNVLDSIGCYSIMASLKLTDLMEETSTKLRLFHGGAGMMTVNGIAKSAYYAMQFLARLGSTVILKSDDVIVTRQGKTVQILLFRYCHSTSLANHHYRLNDDPYSAFITRLPKQFNLALSGFAPGEYVEEFFSISPQGGSSYDVWLRMGAPEILNDWQVQYLHQSSQPAYKTCIELIDGTFRFTTTLAAHEVQLITLYPKH